MSDSKDVKQEILESAETWTENPFIPLLADAVMQAHLSEQKQYYPEVRLMLARSSVMHSVFALEAAANCCIQQIPRNHRFRKKAEKWDCLEKFDMYLLTRPNQPVLPRDNKLVEAVNELVGIRHSYVHSRTRIRPVVLTGVEAPQIRLEIGASKYNGIPEMTLAWNDTHAKTALNSIVSFLKYYFVDLCQLDSGGVQFILCSLIKSKEGYRVVDGGNQHKVLSLAKTLNIDLSFLGVTQ